MEMKNIAPVELKQLSNSEMGITWSDGHQSVYPVYFLRINCRCALCVDEITGKGRILTEKIPNDVHPIEVSSVGRYALRITWSDGHSTGIYTFEHLRRLCQCQQCRQKNIRV